MLRVVVVAVVVGLMTLMRSGGIQSCLCGGLAECRSTERSSH